ncbi:hypothetical protein WJX81_003442 [Elliptochloris bilobata]|uniref:Protein phosphatase n=1 Tax=Elliptochloris bilobata TaxID=381761 RepID=A0AAW1R208_9CHLO
MQTGNCQLSFSVRPAQPEQQAVYIVDIITGDVRGAGTEAPAIIRLIGSEGQSEEYVLGNDQDEYGFERGTRRRYALDVGRPLGALRQVFVQQVEPSMSDLGSGWYLDRIEVMGPEGALRRFPCHNWLGKSDAGDHRGCQQRHLEPSEDLIAGDAPLAKPLAVATGAAALPHPEKVEVGARAVSRRNEGWAGEDAYFCAAGRNGMVGLGVADGVYMWKTQGIDAGLYSRSLMSTARSEVEGGNGDALAVLKAAEAQVDRDGLQGSSTCCIVLIDSAQGRLTSANVGDSGFVVVGTTPYRSTLQEHSFGCPYQLGHFPNADRGDAAMLMTLPVAPGDMVVLGSDGLWDNLADDALVDAVAEGRARREGAPALARRLAGEAFQKSLDRESESPYSLGASEAFDMVYSGGKRDDITVLVALVQ